LRIARYAVLRDEGNVADVEQLPLARCGIYTHQEAIPWVEATDLQHGHSVWVPYELVHADATVPRQAGSGCFLFSTNGLASGNTATEAALHSLCELIERDCVAVWKMQGVEAQKRSRLCITSVDDPNCVELIARLKAAEIDLVICDVTSDLRVPAFAVMILDRRAQSKLPRQAVAFGAGCHPERGVALTASITEAVQNRVTAISGGCDDLTRRAYAQAAIPREVADAYQRLVQEQGERRWESLPDRVFDCGNQSLTWLLEQLAGQGIRQVCAVPLSPEDAPLHVVRTVAVGLEGLSSSSSWIPGVRARRVAA
jgi:ribosomal protein S12 methylthiotransferase accessory factor